MSTSTAARMQELTVEPGDRASLRLERQPVPAPGDGEALVRVLEVGLDGTDLEVIDGGSGAPPAGRRRLVVGHESLGRVAALGPGVSGLQRGQLVVATVRRPCQGPCPTCDAGAVDMCPTGSFVERGIVGADGYAAEYYCEAATELVPVPESLRAVAVLTEPLSVALKGIERAYHFQGDFPWRPRRALVLGGSLALLAALLLRRRGLEVTLSARSAPDSSKARLIEAMGGRYQQADARPLGEQFPERGFDLVFEAVGVPKLMFQALETLAPNGVLCVAGLPETGKAVELDAGSLGQQLVLENRICFGTVNSNRGHFERALEEMQAIEAQWPGLLGLVVTGRHPLQDYAAALADVDIKNILLLGRD